MNHFVKGWVILLIGATLAAIAKYNNIDQLMIMCLVISGALFGRELTLNQIEKE